MSDTAELRVPGTCSECGAQVLAPVQPALLAALQGLEADLPDRAQVALLRLHKLRWSLLDGVSGREANVARELELIMRGLAGEDGRVSSD